MQRIISCPRKAVGMAPDRKPPATGAAFGVTAKSPSPRPSPIKGEGEEHADHMRVKRGREGEEQRCRFGNRIGAVAETPPLMRDCSRNRHQTAGQASRWKAC